MRGTVVARLNTATAKILSGTVFGQLALVAVTPFLTRIYDPAVIGQFQIAFAVAVITQYACTLGVEFRVPQQSDPNVASGQLKRATLSVVALTLLALATGIAFLASGLPSIGLGIVSVSIINAAYCWAALDNARLARLNEPSVLAARSATYGISAAALQVVLGLAWPTVTSLVAAILIGRMLAHLIRPAKRGARLPRRGSSMPVVGVKEIISWPAAVVLSNVAAQSPLIVVGGLAGAEEAAQLALAQRTAGALATVLGAGLAQSFVVRLSSMLLSHASTVPAYVKRLQLRLIAVGGILAILVAVSAPVVMPVVFGAQWGEAGILTSILAIPYGLQLVVRATLPIFPAMGFSARLAGLQLVRVLSAAIAMLVTWAMTGSVRGTVAGFAGVSCLALIWSVIATQQVANKAVSARHVHEDGVASL
ncbi:lipopolysaccharide biosynthesis protein [Blastococcus sp. SYSU DS0552]